MSLNTKYAKILYEEMLNDVTKNPDEWLSFLKSVTWTFEYPFSEQLLIYAQKPDAKAVATMEFWNKSFHRWIKKGTKAIRLLKYENGQSYMENVFDVSDTYQNYGKFKGLWQLDISRDEKAYIEQLESKYGELADSSNIESAITSAIENLVEDNIDTYFEEIPYLEKAEQEYKDIFKELVRDSVIYAVKNRVGIQNDDYTFKMYFEKINYIADPEIISVFGNACRDLTRDVIRETRSFVKNRTFELNRNNVYVKDNKEIEKGGIENEPSEPSIQSSEGLSNTRLTSNEQSEESEWQIRNSEGELLKDTQEGNVRQNGGNGNINSSLEPTTTGVRRTDGDENRSTDEERQLDGTNESPRPDGVGTENELNQNGSRTRSNEGIRTGINGEILSVSEQINLIDNLIQEENKEVVTDFDKQSQKLQSFFDENIAKPVLRTTLSNMINGIPPEILTDEKQKEEPQERNQFVIRNDDLGVGGDKEKYKNNVEAIKLLKRLESENRLANSEEQEVLSKYVGWGGLSKTFDKKADDWKEEYNELLKLLTPTEYENAIASTRTAFYTPPIVISAMYEALSNMGFKKGNILEPSCGTGNFIGRLPEEMADSKIYGVELDSISGRIAKQLYQKSNIAIQGFEETTFPDNSFDIAIGNVPFDDYSPSDKRYDKYHFKLHDYFVAKSIDKVRAGGVIAYITSKGTLDKENNSFRKYIAQRADLIGAIRLPNNAFSRNAGTRATTDIIFLQKRELPNYEEPEWIYLDKDEDGITMNRYFIDNPQMVLGKMEMKSVQYGRMDAVCSPIPTADLKEQLKEAITKIRGQISEIEIDEVNSNEKDTSLPADLNLRNYSYTVVDGKIYYRENSLMYLQELPDGTAKRIKKLVDIRNTTRRLIELQTYGASDEEIKSEQSTLNFMYDNFVVEFGRICSRANRKAFEDDSSYYLLTSLEVNDDKGNFLNKADMFFKRTIKPHREVENVNNSTDALIASISEKAKVDLDYMSEISKLPKETLIKELQGSIFKIPYSDEYVTVSEYLSGNVRQKLEIAKQALEQDESLAINVKYLEDAIPEDLQASEITVKLGATWIPSEYIQQFMYETFGTSYSRQYDIKITYSDINSSWYISSKSADYNNVKVNTTYGTRRMNAYKILENTLNMKDIKIFDKVIDDNGNEKPVLNRQETAIARSKQDLIKEAFEEWIWKDVDRREKLVRLYNDKFNSIRPREYDGDNITFYGINPDITLRKHQIDAIAHILYGGNTLLAHEVGAGKTFEMVASCMESKRLGLSTKALFVVPNHIIEQFASEFLQLYPSANIMVATKKDFSTNYRKRFCSKIATGEYDAIIIGHSQFERVPVSPERRKRLLQDQINEIIDGIDEAEAEGAEDYTVKELQRTKKHLEEKLKKLNDVTRKDDTIYFEELGVDKMFVDEAHNYKNLFLYTKMRNVSGIAQTEAQKSSDLFLKCRYLDELTHNRGVVFATGTPVSNSMVELYTMQRYLQYDTLIENNLQNFDAWASTFGEVLKTLELAPEGTGYREKTSFARFNNLPELMAMFKEIADIQTSETLHLPVPEAKFYNVATEPSDFQKTIVEGLGERAEKIRAGGVDPSTDNMLKITNDGRKLALDQRLLDDMLPDYENSKINVCANNIYKMYKEYDQDKMAQLVFCDLSTPKNLIKSSEIFDMIEQDENAEVPFIDAYTDLKCKLMKKGIPRDEIAFIHEADNEEKKKELFAKVRNGKVRVLIGSTQKMGAGTNVQTRLIALHDLDCPYRPADLTQRLGRIVRQGNMNKLVHIYRYVTKNTFDSYLFQLVEKKQKFISQIMTSKTPVRSAEDVDEVALSYGEIKALASGNPMIMEKVELDAEVARLKLLKQSFLNQKYSLEDKIVKYYPSAIEKTKNNIELLIADKKQYDENKQMTGDNFAGITLNEVTYSEKEQAGKQLLAEIKKITTDKPTEIGTYRGFHLQVFYDGFSKVYKMNIVNQYHYQIELGSDEYGNLTRLENAFERIEKEINYNKEELENLETQFENAKIEVKADFKYETELKEKQVRLNEVNEILKINEKDNSVMDIDDSSDNLEKGRDDDFER